MARFKLLAGLHIQADPDWEPSDEDKRLARETGRPPKPPSRTYKMGEVVESDDDLDLKFGTEKFQRLGERRRKVTPGIGPSRTPGDVSPMVSPAVAPGGQVSTGFQQSTTTPEGTTVSGPMVPPDNLSRQEQRQFQQEFVETHGEEYPTEGDEDDDLSGKTVSDLRKLAGEERIDIHGLVRKDEILTAIREGRRSGK